ncbi:hypothetical protein [Micromonospora endophytica]|uniref:Uncharacterized protein n=1 Tax=Micromonospora endophytica TaxID=515350 RepID=A0A2W2CKG6_9ACTN|nr:hypothetical protein [Micromonospora endophytica]PZF92188.1 hypothetical protein C1I93_19900 [Micromonospora endophytica]RIW41464.1 hypothetical protein D3H59_26045 [Micromonospora endophytica]BCJ58308.1 hypothetical protein Jiend_17300 [Micromonospora endophytica]
MRVDEQSTDPIDQILGDLPVPTSLTPEDVRLAVRAVVVHAAEEWPTVALCRNDGARFPCRLHRWGRRVLLAHGLNERQLDALIRHGNPFVHVPFPFLVNGPNQGRTPAQRPPAGYPARPQGTAGYPPRPQGVGYPARTPGYPARPDRGAAYPARPDRAGGHPTRGPVPRVAAPAARTGAPEARTGAPTTRAGTPATRTGAPAARTAGTRTSGTGRPVAPPATAPRWPRAS